MTKEEGNKYFEKVDSSEYYEKVETEEKEEQVEEKENSVEVETKTDETKDTKNVKNLKFFKKISKCALPVGLALTIIGGGCGAIMAHNNTLKINVSDAEREQYQVRFLNEEEIANIDRYDLDELWLDAEARSIDPSVEKKHIWSSKGLTEEEKEKYAIVNMEVMTGGADNPHPVYRDFLYTDLKLTTEFKENEYFLVKYSDRCYFGGDDSGTVAAIKNATETYWGNMDAKRNGMALVRGGLSLGAYGGLIVGIPVTGFGIFSKFNKGNQKTKTSKK